MANSRTTSHARLPQRRCAARGTPWMSERQLDAYLQARDTLRRVGTIARLTTEASQPAAPPSSL